MRYTFIHAAIIRWNAFFFGEPAGTYGALCRAGTGGGWNLGYGIGYDKFSFTVCIPFLTVSFGERYDGIALFFDGEEALLE